MAADGVVLTESVMTHMLADIDQIVTEMEIDPDARCLMDWTDMLRHAVEGRDYVWRDDRVDPPGYPD